MPNTEQMPPAGGSTPSEPDTSKTPAPDQGRTVAAADTVAEPQDSAAPQPVVVKFNGGNPNAPPAEEVVAASFESNDVAEKAIEDIVAAGVDRDAVVHLTDRTEKFDFLKRYVHRDGDRHTHSGVAAVFSGLLGALALGIIAVATLSQYIPGENSPFIAALIGGVVGGALGAILGGFAIRPADDSSVTIIENIASRGTLVAVRRPLGTETATIGLDEVGRMLQRHNGRAIRLRHQSSQADQLPGDMRSGQMWDNERPGIAARRPK